MLKGRIMKKEKLIGSYVQLADPAISRILGLSGFDCIWVDTEHSYMSLETLLGHITALRSTGTPMIVRLPESDLTATKRVLEMGPDGIIFPMVRSKEKADELIATTLYPPYGTRGFGPMGAIDYGFRDVPDYIEKSRDEICRFIQIEHIDAIENLENIVKNEYIDGYIFGANDLAASIGLLGKPFAPEVTELIEKGVKILKEHGKYVAIAAGGLSEEICLHWQKFNPDMFFVGADFDFLRDGALRTRKMSEKYFKNI